VNDLSTKAAPTATGRDSGQALPLMEAFLTIQGEGYHQGKGAWFIRLAGCDVGCVWCDVKESWEAGNYPEKPIAAMAQEAKESGAGIAVITGGEPLMYDLDALCRQLHRAGLRTHLETSGAHPLSGRWDWICLSPKKFKKPLPAILSQADELKVVVYNKSDFDWAERHARQVSSECRLYLQPEWSRVRQMTPRILDYLKENPRWEMSLQLHKYLNIP